MELPNGTRRRAFQQLLERVENGRLAHGALTEVAEIHGVSRQQITCIWKRGAQLHPQTKILLAFNINNVENRHANSGRPVLYDREEFKEALKAMPVRERTSLRNIAEVTKVSESTVHRLVGVAMEHHHVNAKPKLSDQNKLARMAWALDHQLPNGLYADMQDIIHLDEKWFNIDTTSQKVYLAKGERAPSKRMSNKRYVSKVMFLCAVARPQWDAEKGTHFNGKIGIWPFAELRPARRGSRNRPAGTMEYHDVPVNRETYKRMIIENVLPAVHERMPRTHHSFIFQHDNATPHTGITTDDPDLLQKVQQLQMRPIKIVCQPPNSPDLNILDLGFFSSLQHSFHKTSYTNKNQLVEGVITAFNTYESSKINHCFLTLQCVMNKVIETEGGNEYPLPHMSKARLEREGLLPVSIHVTNATCILNN